MLSRTISLIFLMGNVLLCKAMSVREELVFEKIHVDEKLQYREKTDIEMLRTITLLFSLKKQLAIKMVKFIAEGRINLADLKKLPEELKEYLTTITLIESLNPENPKPLILPKGITTNFGFLTSIYLIDDNSSLFANLSLLASGLQKIDLSKKYHLQITPTLLHWGQPNIDPITTLEKLLRKATTPHAADTPDHEFRKLVQYCVQFNNLDLLIFLNLAESIPLDADSIELTGLSNSIIDLACVSSEQNIDIINFLIEEASKRDIDWTHIVSEKAILRGMISMHKEKRSLLHTFAKALNINLNQSIGCSTDKTDCSPIMLSVRLGYKKSFKLFLREISTEFDTDSQESYRKRNDLKLQSSTHELYQNILEQFMYVVEHSTEEYTRKFLENELKILKLFVGHITKYNSMFLLKETPKLRTLKKNLKKRLKNAPQIK